MEDVLLLRVFVFVARRHRIVEGQPLEDRLLDEDRLSLADDLVFELHDEPVARDEAKSIVLLQR